MYYRDHPQDIRHRTVQSRKPPPVATHLIRGDPDSATSPSKYRTDLPDVALTATEGDQEQYFFSDLPPEFAPLDSAGSTAERPFRTLSTTESEGEAESSKQAAVQRRKPKKKKGQKDSKSGNDSAGLPSSGSKEEGTSSMVSFLQTKDKNVSHVQIESFIHKSKVKYSVDEIRTAIENARSIGGEGKDPTAEEHQRIAQKWKKVVEVVQNKSGNIDEMDIAEESIAKSKSRNVDTVKEGHKRLQLIKDARKAQKFDKMVPNTPNSIATNDSYYDEPEQPTPTETKTSKSKGTKGRAKTKKEDSGPMAQTMSVDTGKKTTLALVTLKKGAKKPSPEPTTTDGFYKDFKIIYVILPEPVDELPRE